MAKKNKNFSLGLSRTQLLEIAKSLGMQFGTDEQIKKKGFTTTQEIEAYRKNLESKRSTARLEQYILTQLGGRGAKLKEQYTEREKEGNRLLYDAFGPKGVINNLKITIPVKTGAKTQITTDGLLGLLKEITDAMAKEGLIERELTSDELNDVLWELRIRYEERDLYYELMTQTFEIIAAIQNAIYDLNIEDAYAEDFIRKETDYERIERENKEKLEKNKRRK